MPRSDGIFVGAFDIAGVACRLECREEALWSLLSSRYAGFVSDDVPQLSLRVEVTAAPPDEAWARWSGPFAKIAGGDGVLSIEGPGFSGTYDERSGKGWITQALDPSPLETFLTAICAGRLLRADGFFLHAAAIVEGQKAYVFFGPSGSGKTTVADLVGEGVISDEIVAIRRVGNRYRVSGVPWRGQRLSARLAALFRLRKAPETSFIALSPARALRELLTSVFFSRPDGDEVGRFFEIGGEMVRNVPCYEMRFAPDRSFWRMLPRRGERENHALSL